MKKITIHSDGGCDGNPGPGGWAAVLRFGEHVKEISGGCPATTNNRMEMQAAVEALQSLKEPCEVEFFTDSKYLQDGISTWIKKWKARGWRTVGKAPVKNEDLWRALDQAVSLHRVHWCWLKGHAGHKDNERCDELAGTAIAKIRKGFSREQLAAALREFEQLKNASRPPSTPQML